MFKKFLVFMYTIILTLTSSTVFARQADDVSLLRVYAGPQSARPDQKIFVTIEAKDYTAQSLSEQAVILHYRYNDQARTLTANLKDGLAVLEIPAQSQAGHMQFYAKLDGLRSNQALITVTPASPKAFTMSTKQALAKNSVEFLSSPIVDNYGNLFPDFSLAQLSWFDPDGLLAQQDSLLSLGQIFVDLPCPKIFKRPLKMRANFMEQVFISPDLSKFCINKEA